MWTILEFNLCSPVTDARGAARVGAVSPGRGRRRFVGKTPLWQDELVVRSSDSQTSRQTFAVSNQRQACGSRLQIGLPDRAPA